MEFLQKQLKTLLKMQQLLRRVDHKEQWKKLTYLEDLR